MAAQGNMGFSYRFMLDPGRGVFLSVPVLTLGMLRDNIVEDEVVGR